MKNIKEMLTKDNLKALARITLMWAVIALIIKLIS